MTQLEHLQPNAALRGILPDALVTVVNVQWYGSDALELTYKTATGKVANELLYRHDEARLEIVEQGRPWSFDGDGALFRLTSEAQRIRLAHLFEAAGRLCLSRAFAAGRSDRSDVGAQPRSAPARRGCGPSSLRWSAAWASSRPTASSSTWATT